MTVSIFDLTSKVAIVTGSGRGIGKAIAIGLAGAGARVALVARTFADIEATASEIKTKGGIAIPISTDVRDSEQLANMIHRTLQEFGRIDILVNNAGGSQNRLTPAMEMSWDIWDANIRFNLTAVFMCCQMVGKVMSKQNKGSIINVSSVGAVNVLPGQAAYNAAKAGVCKLTRDLAVEWGRYNIRVNAILPGTIPTERILERMRTQVEDYALRLEFTPLGRHGKPEDFIGIAICLASDASSFITGQLIQVDGGKIVSAPKRRKDESSIW